MQFIDFLARALQDLAHRGLTQDVTLIQSIDTDCDKFYKDVKSHLKKTKTKSDDSQVIDPPTLKINTIPN